MSKSVGIELLAAYAAGKLTGAEAATVEAAIARDPAAAGTVARFRSMVDTARADDSVEPPASVLQSARDLFRRQPSVNGVAWLNSLRRIVAGLIFDSRPQLAMAGFRGAGDQYQLAFESDEADVDLEIAASGEKGGVRRIRGQISPHGSGHADSIVLVKPGTFEAVVSTTADSNGMFTLIAGAGAFDLLIELPDAVVVLPNVELR